MPSETLHPCEYIYKIGASGKIYGDVPGICRITGKEKARREGSTR